MDLELTGKRAVVTGASRGIGLAVARMLRGEGVDVALIGRDSARLEAVATELTSAPGGPRALPVSCDTGDDEAVAAMAHAVEAEFGGVDILVNCAARPNTGPIPDEDFDEHLNVKVKGYLRCARALAPGMVDRGWGRIVNVSGMAARQSGSVVGSVRNVAVAAMTKNLADEYGPSGINVTVVHPGMTRTERTPETIATMARAQDRSPDEVEAGFGRATAVGRMITAEEVAAVIVFLASPLSVAVNGDAIAAGGGVRGPIHY